MPIRAHFRQDEIPELSAPELRELRDTMFGKPGRAADNAAASFLSTFGQLDPFKSALDRNLIKFTFGAHSQEEWRRRYCLPDPQTIDLQLRSLGVAQGDVKMARSQVINGRPDDILAWTRRFLIARRAPTSPRGAESVVFVQGTIGSGKSTLNKYITNVLFDEFKGAKVIPSRIECKKVLADLREGHEDDGPLTVRSVFPRFINLLKRAMVRDIITYSRTSWRHERGETRLASAPHEPDWPNVADAEFLDFVRRSLREARRDAAAAEELVGDIREVFDRIGRKQPAVRGPVTRQAIGALDPFALDLVIGWYQENDFRHCLMFDGFDYIDAADFFDTSDQTVLLDVLAHWITERECQIRINCADCSVEPNVSLTVRRNTRSIIGRKHNQIYNVARARTAYVLSPSMGQLFRVLVRDVSELSDETRSIAPKVLMKILEHVRKSIKRELDLSDGLSIASLFNGNVRHQLNYTRDVINELAATAIRENFVPKGVPELLRYIDLEARNFLEGKRYRFIDLLLYSAGHRFANFVNVRSWSPDGSDACSVRVFTPQDICDNNLDSGYVGNVLNYHSGYHRPSDEAFLLEKVRILELLRRRGDEERGRGGNGEASEHWLREQFARNRWPASPHFRLSICLLVREGMLEVVESDREEIYSLLPLGRVATDRLIAKMVYLENVYFGTWLPEWMRKVSHDVTRGSGVDRWVSASLFHVWHLLRFVRHAESIGVDGEKPQGKFVFERMRAGVERSVVSMAQNEQSGDAEHRPTAVANAWINRYRRDVLKLRDTRDGSARASPAAAAGHA